MSLKTLWKIVTHVVTIYLTHQVEQFYHVAVPQEKLKVKINISSSSDELSTTTYSKGISLSASCDDRTMVSQNISVDKELSSTSRLRRLVLK